MARNVKIVEPSRLDTNALRDFRASMEIVQRNIQPLAVSPVISFRPPIKGNVARFQTEGDVGVTLNELESLRESVKDLMSRIRPVKKTLLNSLVSWERRY